MTALQRGFEQTGWSVNDLFVAATGIGGELRHRDVGEITRGERGATRGEHDVLAAALNEYFTDHGQDHPVAMWDELPTTSTS